MSEPFIPALPDDWNARSGDDGSNAPPAYEQARRARQEEKRQKPARTDAPCQPLHSAAQFTEGFVPPDYVWDGIIQRRRLYAMTGRTGSGKTSVALSIASALTHSDGSAW